MNKNILNWLNILIKERFSDELQVIYQKNALKLKLKNSERSIIFDKLQKKFLNFGSDLSFTKWKPEEEGFISISNTLIAAPTSLIVNLPIIEKKKENYFIHYDILGLAYWKLNCLEEVESKNFDNFKRFNFKKSHAYIYKYFNQPIVDYWFDILSQVINRLWPNIKLKTKYFFTNISHDVDRPFLQYSGKNFHTYLRNIASDIFNGNLYGYKKLPLLYLKKFLKKQTTDPYDTFEWIMNAVEKENLKSNFNFIFGGTHVRDAYYSMKNKEIINLTNNIYKRGHSIGAHLSFNCFDNFNQIKEEINLFKHHLNLNKIYQNKIITRMHYLRWSMPKTLIYLDKAGVDVDTSLGYSGISGYRCGTCHPYLGFDTINYKLLNIRIYPLILMDISLTSNNNLSFEDAYNVASDLRTKCRKVNGVFTILWHNSNLIDRQRKELFLNLINN